MINMMFPISQIKITDFAGYDFEEYESYIDYIHTDYKPIKIMADGSLVDGRHRLAAAVHEGFTEIDVEIVANDYLNED